MIIAESFFPADENGTIYLSVTRIHLGEFHTAVIEHNPDGSVSGLRLCTFDTPMPRQHSLMGPARLVFTLDPQEDFIEEFDPFPSTGSMDMLSKCPACRGKVQSLGEDEVFCLNCEWDNLEARKRHG